MSTPESRGGAGKLKCDIINCASKSIEYLTCPSCLERAHRECLSMDKKFFETLKSKKYSGVFWQCKNCYPNANKNPLNSTELLREVRDDLKSEIMAEIKNEINNLTELINNKLTPNSNIKQNLNSESTTYKSKVEQSTKHTICIKPKEGGSSFSSDSWNQVKLNIQPKLKNIPISKSVHSKAGKGILFFPDANSRNLAATNLKDTYELETQDREKKTIYPKLKISWISKHSFNKLDKTTLKDSILEKNSSINQLVKEENKLLDVLFIGEERDKAYNYAVIKVDPKVKEAIESKGNKIFIGMASCKVSERYHLLQCYRCQRFGHKRESDRCCLHNTNTEICMYCSANHASRTCPFKSNKTELKCNNCFISENPQIKTNYVGHTTNSNECPVLQNALKETMNRTLGTTYRVGVPKNLITT